MMERSFISQEEIARQMAIANGLRNELAGRGLLYYVETFGCQMNVRDSETIRGILDRIGYRESDDKEHADFILFNTCCVREHAEKRLMGNIGALRELKEENPSIIIAVCGCMMQQKDVAKKILRRFQHVSLVFGPNVIFRLPEMLASVLEGSRIAVTSEENFAIAENLPQLRDNPRSAFVNITYGCNNYCTYCIVPYVRGPERSRDMQDILREMKALTDSGVTEITLLGQNVNSYGKDLPDASFAQLLCAANNVPGLKRLRFMTSHPKDLSDDVIRAIAENDHVCHHVHLPVQSGSNAVLKRMNRKYTREQYLEIVNKLREAVPDIEFTTDIIVGFPGETDEQFHETLSLVDEVGFAAAFTFVYSPRAGTPAAKMSDQIPEQVKKQRLQELNALQAKKTVENNSKYIGFEDVLLVEGYDERSGETILHGKFQNFKMVYFPGEKDLMNRYVRVRVLSLKNNSLIGEKIDG